MVAAASVEDTGGTRFRSPTMPLALLDEPSLRPDVSMARFSPPERAAHRGPGWFDSSWDLTRGCEVREGWPVDATLREWIEGWLYPAAGGSSLSAT
jgi:hypothetical protein